MLDKDKENFTKYLEMNKQEKNKAEERADK